MLRFHLSAALDAVPRTAMVAHHALMIGSQYTVEYRTTRNLLPPPGGCKVQTVAYFVRQARPCVWCGRSTQSRHTRTNRPQCLECSLARMIEATRQMRDGAGEI